MLNVPQQSGLGREYTSQNKVKGKTTNKNMKENSRLKNDNSKYKTNTTQENKVNYVTHNNLIATPKELISNDFNQRGQ